MTILSSSNISISIKTHASLIFVLTSFVFFFVFFFYKRIDE